MKITSAEFVKSAFGERDWLRDDRAEVAFVGRSNVGKSSVLNRLLDRKGLARTSSTPGRTQAINYFLVNKRFYFVDLPGYGYAKAGQRKRREWAKIVDGYLHHTSPGLQVTFLVDAKVGATELDVQAFDYLSDLKAKLTIVTTKIDRISKNRRAAGLMKIRYALGLSEDDKLVSFSAHSGEGIRELWREISVALSTRTG